MESYCEALIRSNGLIMIVVINGSFGVGKTTIAKLLRRSLPGSAIYDPERVGFVLQRLPGWIKLEGAGSDDYQNIVLWRRSAVAGVRLFRLLGSGPVIVPMAFSRRDYFDEVVTGIEPLDSQVRVFCLKASLATIRKRLAERGTKIEGPGTEWIARRIVECVEAHIDPHFGEPVDTECRSADEVSADIIKRLHLQTSRRV
jgi:predicted kinase